MLKKKKRRGFGARVRKLEEKHIKTSTSKKKMK